MAPQNCPGVRVRHGPAASPAPVTRRSGKSDFVVARRLAHNHYLGNAVPGPLWSGPR